MQEVVAGFTGTQKGMTEAQRISMQQLLQKLNVVELHHGDCIGADAQAHELAKDLGIFLVIHPPAIEAKRAWKQGDVHLLEKPYLERNRDIVYDSQLLIATPKSTQEELRSGTWATVRHARKLKKSVYLIFPSGEVRCERF
jgi:hypothetical protein